jgi:hypothetical protein
VRFFFVLMKPKSKEAENYTTIVKFKTVYNLGYIFIVFLHVRRKVDVLGGLSCLLQITIMYALYKIGQI